MKKVDSGGRPEESEPSRLVLTVEDEEENWMVTQLRLGNHYRLLWARSAREACELVRGHGAALYAILMDIQLKGSVLDGIQLTRLFRGTLPEAERPDFAHGCKLPDDLPIIFVTAYGSRYSEEELIAAGGSHFTTKPVDFVKLNGALAKFTVRRIHGHLPKAAAKQ